jgi:peptidoglycan/LPS O-acetylase OafA/YrhL
MPKSLLSPLRATFPPRLKNIARPITSRIPPALLPSFLQPRNNSESASNTKVSPTAWLDGMRGLAAFFVYIRHFGAIHHPDIQPGFGSSDSNRYITQLPFIRLLVSGPAMVALFFIISGYALSWGPLKSIHGGAVDKSLERLSSATFRRAMRLFLPGIVSTFFVMLCISLSMYDRGHRAWASNDDVPGFKEPQPPMWRKDPFSVQFWDWVRSSWQWINIWQQNGHAYNPHLWTLSVEFRSSIALFMVLLALARTRAVWRLAGLGGMVMYCYYTSAWAEWLFFAGAFLAQVKMIQDERQAALPVAVKSEEDVLDDVHPKGISTADSWRIITFVAGLYLLSAPDYGHGRFRGFHR